jgi:flagellar biogenesis protein FliO
LSVDRSRELLIARVKGLPLWAWILILAGIFLAAALVGGYPAPAQPASGNPAGAGGLPGAGAVASTRQALGVFLKLSLVIGLAYLGLFFLRRWRGSFLVKTARQLSVLESVHLSPRQALHLVRAGGQVLLVGATDQSLTLLGQVAIELPAGSGAEACLPLPAAPGDEGLGRAALGCEAPGWRDTVADSFAGLFARYFPGP